mgnify:CR=1 FL=1
MKKRLIGATLITVVAALLISNAVGIWMFRSREMDTARDTLHALLVLMDAQSAITDAEGLTDQFRQAAPGKRLTIIDTNGTVLSDTESNPDDLDNHSSRPEVEQARAIGWGETTRYSDTLGTTMFYVAKQFADGMVGRAAMPLSSIDSLVWNGVWAFLAASLVAIILALVLARRSAARVLEPLGVVSNTLQGVLDGTYTPTLDAYRADDELRPILRYIDKLVERLGSYIQEITGERDKVNLILDCMDEGFLLLDEQGNILASNRAARTLFGVPEGEENGSILVFIHSRRLKDAIREARQKKTAVVLDVDDPMLLNGRSLRMFLSPVTGRQYEGESVGTSILISDVTELKKAEGIRSEFTANVSHELKTPLTSIKGFTDMLSSGMVTSSEDQKRFLTMIGVEVDRLIELINDILKLSELESVTIDQCQESADALAAAQEVAQLLAPNAEQAQVTVRVSGESVPAAIPYGRLKELLLNLVENGIKYNEPGGAVDISVEKVDTFVRLTVSDTGIGIPEEAQDRVFERFYRVDKGRARKNGGTGLGLAIVKHIAALYGGRVTLDSTLGKGSTFRVVLPQAKTVDPQ